jgi:hypothetical protein
MVSEDQICKFLFEKQSIVSFNNGSGDGNGSGSGDGDGSGYGSGYGDGYGYGYGNGYGSGYGDGYGYGNGYGNGSGYGSGNGDGDGNGYGNGSGYGSGYGEQFMLTKKSKFFLGYSNNEKVKLNKLFGRQVVYIDELPCFINSIKGNIALISVIDVDDNYLLTDMFVIKNNNMFAHGKTIKDAQNALINKIFASLNKEERIAEFKKKFKKGILYSNKEFYNWHHLLTGSCESGRNHFVKSKKIDLEDKMTVETFVRICSSEYGGDVIKQLLN